MLSEKIKGTHRVPFKIPFQGEQLIGTRGEFALTRVMAMRLIGFLLLFCGIIKRVPKKDVSLP